VPPLDVGYPIAEVEADGSFTVTKHPGTGGRVSRASVTEQLLYEIADPAAYLTPDVAADFRPLEVVAVGPDRVTVRGARGAPPTDTLKVTIVYRDGWRAVGFALISGPDVRAKSARLAEMIWHRVGTDFLERRAELIGDRSCWGAAAPDVEPNEGFFRAAVRDPLAEVKELVREVTTAAAGEVGRLTAERIARLRASAEGQDGLAAFLDKRRPRWVP
jgi:hypothetical protein